MTSFTHHYIADSADLGLSGALDLVRTRDGFRPRRLPHAAWEQVPHAFMRTMVECPAGVRLRFMTEARNIAVVLVTRTLYLLDTDQRFSAAVDLVVDGSVIASQMVGRHHVRIGPGADRAVLEAAEPETVEFAGLRVGPKLVEIWLPHSAVVDLVTVMTDGPVVPAPSQQMRWVHYGSSISHCLEASVPTRTWPALVARGLDLDLVDLGLAGSALLDPFVARAIRDTDADLITVKVGINLVNLGVAHERMFAPLMNGFLDTIREGHPATPIVVISPVTCPAHEHTPGPTGVGVDGVAISLNQEPLRPGALTLTDVRRILSDIVTLRSATDAHVSYIAGDQLFRDADVTAGRLPDGLHPDERGYQLIASRVEPMLGAVIEDRR
ncbi:SGNH/GDSL hydrolase family protein [Plantibacter sp. MMLR14_011]|uniref:SGNH/GDSL hydrolase family protein n=1 Tax=Plantibacter sp. MMLR14_011 TaxID=1898746 RepID=UPI0008DCB36A|nr:SGNH/GDSL hydrolase family protein [Plantibacter sp. MMLR14_011]OII39272.1 hypothetical protein BIU99_07770 [Plantibacter sp. MMLR14_011]